MANRIFKESQTYLGTWIMYAMIMTEVPIIILLIVLYVTSDEKQEMATSLGVVVGSLTLVSALIFNLKLETRIDEKSISFRYIPFIWKWRRYPKETIKSCTVISYNPITDFGGWGLKGNKTTKGYSVVGDEGVLLDVGKEKKIMIGTMKAKELKAFLENWIER